MEVATPCQRLESNEEVACQVMPESEERNTPPLPSLSTQAMSREPSAEEATAYHSRLLSRAVHVLPESVEVKSWPGLTPATSFVPSLDMAMLLQLRGLSLAVHEKPPSDET